MTGVPGHPQIYHITHVENLPSVLAAGGLRSDAGMKARSEEATSIGMSEIKLRRLRLPVRCHSGEYVGNCVPFYFCPRSIMLYLIHRGNHSALAYRGGQDAIVHLEADLHETVAWAESQGHFWAFSLSNAGASYAEFRDRLEQLGEVDWSAVEATDFRDRQIKEGKQAEFLVREFFSWNLVRRIGVNSPSMQNRVVRALSGSRHRPVVEVRRDWYY